MNARICVATPVYGDPAAATVSALYAGTLFALNRQLDVICGEEGWGLGNVSVEPCPIPSDVVHARSFLVAQVLAHPKRYTHVLWWDADVVGGTPQIAGLIRTMLKLDRDIIGVPYPRKKIFWDDLSRKILAWGPGEERGWPSPPELADASLRYPTFPTDRPLEPDKDGLVEREYVPIGFSLMKREALEKMTEAYRSELGYSLREGPFAGFPIVALFMLTLEDGYLFHEDNSFCKRWRKLGGKLHLYLGEGAPLGHVGAHVYQGRAF